jgi:hypothetical protein
MLSLLLWNMSLFLATLYMMVVQKGKELLQRKVVMLVGAVGLLQCSSYIVFLLFHLSTPSIMLSSLSYSLVPHLPPVVVSYMVSTRFDALRSRTLEALYVRM